jgi:hypothetical protein
MWVASQLKDLNGKFGVDILLIAAVLLLELVKRSSEVFGGKLKDRPLNTPGLGGWDLLGEGGREVRLAVERDVLLDTNL